MQTDCTEFFDWSIVLGSSFSRVRRRPLVLPPASIQFDAQSGQIVQQLQVEAFTETFHKAVLWIQAETHRPEDLCVVLAQMIESVQELFQVGMGVHHIGCQDVVETMCGTWEPLLQLLTPGQLCHLSTLHLHHYYYYLDHLYPNICLCIHETLVY